MCFMMAVSAAEKVTCLPIYILMFVEHKLINMDINNKSDLRKCVADLRNKLRAIGAENV